MPAADMGHVLIDLKRYPAAAQRRVRGVAAADRARRGARSSRCGGRRRGLRIARQTARSWEPAAEYFRASPRVLQALSYPQFQRWVDGGIELCADSPTMAAAYFRASPGVLPHLLPRNVAGWAGLGRGLSRGTWKSASLAARFFDASADLAAHLSFREMQGFVGLVDALSYRSYDLAADCLHLGQRILPTVAEREEIISLASAAVDGSWREVRGCFEGASKVNATVNRPLRARFYRLTEQLTRRGLSNISLFLSESTQSMARIPQDAQDGVIAKAEDLVNFSHEAVTSFLTMAPSVLQRISGAQFQHWYDQGRELLAENQDGGRGPTSASRVRAPSACSINSPPPSNWRR